MFADEPTGNLDSTTSAEILELLRDSVSSYGQTTVMVTHDAHAAAIADRVLFLADGAIVNDLGPLHAARDPRGARGGDRPMIGVALKGLLGRKLRAMLTAFAIVLGVAMISGSFVLTDTLGKSFDGVYSESYKATDAVISSKAGDQDRRRRPRGAGVLRRRAAARSQASPACSVAQGVDRGRGAARRRERQARSATPDDGVAVGVDPAADQSLNPLKLVSGHLAAAATADRDRQGDRRRSTTSRSARRSARSATARSRSTAISGIVRFGTIDSLGGATISVFDLATAQRLFDKQRQARPDPRRRRSTGVSEAQLVAQIAPLLSATTQVKSAEAQAAADSKDTQEGLSSFKYFLLGFGGIALFVGSFVIANTLAITVAQRMRELATLRTLGASRRQVLGSVVLESVVDRPRRLGRRAVPRARHRGRALTALLEATGVELPSSGLVFAPRTIVVSLAVGTLIAAAGEPAAGDPRHARSSRSRPSARARCCPPSRFARYAAAASPRFVGARGRAASRYGLFARRSRHQGRGSSRSSPACCCCSSASRWSRPGSSARSPSCSARPAPASAAPPAGSPARTRCATRRGPPRPPPR